MSNNFLYAVSSVAATHFREALAAASATFIPPYVGTPIYNLPGVPPIGSRMFLIRGIKYIAAQNVGLEFDFFSTAAGNTTDPATNTFKARYQFSSANGVQLNGAGPYLYYVDGLAIQYDDFDTINTQTPPTLHVAVQNVDTIAKSAGDPGAIRATFFLEPMQAW